MNQVPAMPGLSLAAIVILALIVVVLALVIIKQIKPNSAVGKEVARVEATAEGWGRTFATDADAFAAGFKRIEPILQTELQAVLTAAEKRLTNTDSEDAKIAQAQTDTAAANADKATKLALIQTHIATLQAHVAAQQSAS